MAETAAALSPISLLSDDIVLNIFNKLQSEPREWARLACVSARFSTLIRNVCCRDKCVRSIPSVVADLLSPAYGDVHPPGGWAALHKLSICCPGLIHAGVLLENSDFALEREIGPDESCRSRAMVAPAAPCCRQQASSSSLSSSVESTVAVSPSATPPSSLIPAACSWSVFDDHAFCVSPESQATLMEVDGDEGDPDPVPAGCQFSKRRKKIYNGQNGTHLASGVWNLSREQGSRLLASRFRGDCLYICDWPGCVHAEEKRKYMLFRGVFKNFKRSRVWKTMKDAKQSKIHLDCAFCPCKEAWDLHAAFCLRRVFGFHDDGEPVVRAYVCENGHVSGAWTERPMYA